MFYRPSYQPEDKIRSQKDRQDTRNSLNKGFINWLRLRLWSIVMFLFQGSTNKCEGEQTYVRFTNLFLFHFRDPSNNLISSSRIARTVDLDSFTSRKRDAKVMDVDGNDMNK